MTMDPVLTWDRIQIPDLMDSPISGPDDRSSVLAFGRSGKFSDYDDVLGIYYETDEDTALRVLNRIRQDAMIRFPVSDVYIIHRLGKIPLGEYVYAVIVSGRRTEDAFSACKFAVEEINAEVPMWKYEIRRNRDSHYHLAQGA